MAYEDALSTLAEVAIAIAGFSGIVSVFGRRSSGHWSPAERSRLFGLLIMSFTALLFCVVPFVLLSIPVSESTCWRSLSLLLAVSHVVFVPIVIRNALGALPTPRSEREVSLVLSGIFITGDFLVIAVLLANAFALGVVWPYLAAIIWILTQAASLFARLVMVPIRGASPT